MRTTPPHPQMVLSSSPGGLLPRGPHQNRTRRFPPSGSSADVAHGDAPQIRTRIRGTGRGYRSNNATNLGQVRRVRLLRRRSHVYQCRSVASTSSPKLRALPLTPKSLKCPWMCLVSAACCTATGRCRWRRHQAAATVIARGVGARLFRHAPGGRVDSLASCAA